MKPHELKDVDLTDEKQVAKFLAEVDTAICGLVEEVSFQHYLRGKGSKRGLNVRPYELVSMQLAYELLSKIRGGDLV